MLEHLAPLILLIPRLADAAILLGAAGVSLWSRQPARRAAAWRLIRLLRPDRRRATPRRPRRGRRDPRHGPHRDASRVARRDARRDHRHPNRRPSGRPRCR